MEGKILKLRLLTAAIGSNFSKADTENLSTSGDLLANNGHWDKRLAILRELNNSISSLICDFPN